MACSNSGLRPQWNIHDVYYKLDEVRALHDVIPLILCQIPTVYAHVWSKTRKKPLLIKSLVSNRARIHRSSNLALRHPVVEAEKSTRFAQWASQKPMAFSICYNINHYKSIHFAKSRHGTMKIGCWNLKIDHCTWLNGNLNFLPSGFLVQVFSPHVFLPSLSLPPCSMMTGS